MPPDEVHANLPAGNGERLQLQIGSKSLGFTTKDLVSVLLVVAMMVGFYLTVQSLVKRQELGFSGQQVGYQKLEKLLDATAANQTAILTAIRDNREAIEHGLREQNTLLHQHTTQMRQWLATLLFQLQHPDQPVSLDMPVPPERGR